MLRSVSVLALLMSVMVLASCGSEWGEPPVPAATPADLPSPSPTFTPTPTPTPAPTQTPPPVVRFSNPPVICKGKLRFRGELESGYFSTGASEASRINAQFRGGEYAYPILFLVYPVGWAPRLASEFGAPTLIILAPGMVKREERDIVANQYDVSRDKFSVTTNTTRYTGSGETGLAHDKEYELLIRASRGADVIPTVHPIERC